MISCSWVRLAWTITPGSRLPYWMSIVAGQRGPEQREGFLHDLVQLEGLAGVGLGAAESDDLLHQLFGPWPAWRTCCT